jgi:hypothetical protein
MRGIHTKKFGHRTGETPQEMHARLAWKGRVCRSCGGPPVIRIKVLTPVKEMNPGIVAAIALRNPDGSGQLPVIKTAHGDMLMTADVFACRACRRDAERAAAKGPSFNIVEIDRGVDPTNKRVFGWEGDQHAS